MPGTKGEGETVDFRRLRAQRQAELDEVLLRGLSAERARLNAKLKALLNEIEGTQKIIAEYEALIRDLAPMVQEIRQVLGDLEQQEVEIRTDHDRWQNQLAG